MKILKDYKGRSIRLSDERVRHFVKRLIKAGMLDLIEDTVADPDFVIQSKSDALAAINYKFYRGTKAGDKFLCVVVKYLEDDAYVLTAYPSDEIKKGTVIWERRKK